MESNGSRAKDKIQLKEVHSKYSQTIPKAKVAAVSPSSPSISHHANKPVAEAKVSKTGNKGKSIVPRTISSGAKDTLSKIIKGTRKAFTSSKETVKS
ncbi:hypothetical protein Tsubulata_014535, partial [Turnera subulata]